MAGLLPRWPVPMISRTSRLSSSQSSAASRMLSRVASEAVRSLFLDDDTRHGLLDRRGRLKDLLQGNSVVGLTDRVFDKLVVDEIFKYRRLL